MSQIFGALNIAEASADKLFVQQVGQRAVYDAIQVLLAQHNADLNAAKGILVEGTTSEFKWRYKLPGGGYLQRRGGLARVAAVKGKGHWDVALPLEDFGAGLIEDEISLAYMSIKELDRHLDTIMQQDINTIRREMLIALFNNTTWSFNDDIQGTLSVVPLANGDSVVYPPVIGSETGATDSHYLAAGYLESAIADAHNPFKTIRAELEEHFGKPTGGSSIVTFHNSSATEEIYGLTDFDEVDQKDLVPGVNVDRVINVPTNMPGRVLGKVDGVWAVEWDFIPSDYSLSIDMNVPKPLFERIDAPETGLGSGLQLVAKSEVYPFTDAQYRHRFGFGVGNRLNGVVVHYTAGSFTIPTSLAR
jgi:hypothetical protein